MVNVTGMIDLQTCAQVVSSSYMDNVLPLGTAIGCLTVLVTVCLVFFLFENQEKKLMKDYLRRKNELNKYEDWKKDRKVLE